MSAFYERIARVRDRMAENLYGPIAGPHSNNNHNCFNEGFDAGKQIGKMEAMAHWLKIVYSDETFYKAFEAELAKYEK